MAIKRREFEVFSLSFLDCICCGFGAIILLFILSMGVTRIHIPQEKQKLEHRRTEVRTLYAHGGQNEHTRLSGELAAKERSLAGRDHRNRGHECAPRETARATPERGRRRKVPAERDRGPEEGTCRDAEGDSRHSAGRYVETDRHSGREQLRRLRHRHLGEHARPEHRSPARVRHAQVPGGARSLSAGEGRAVSRRRRAVHPRPG